MLLAEIAALNALGRGIPTGTVGAVDRGHPAPSDFALSQLGGVILAPGLGAQGAGPDDVAERFAGCAAGHACCRAARVGSCGTVRTPTRCAAAAESLVRELAAAHGLRRENGCERA